MSSTRPSRAPTPCSGSCRRTFGPRVSRPPIWISRGRPARRSAPGVKRVVAVSASEAADRRRERRAGHRVAGHGRPDRRDRGRLPGADDALVHGQPPPPGRVDQEPGRFFCRSPATARIPTCATRDIAAVAARLLLDRSWSGQVASPVLGPEDLSFDDMARIMSEVLGETRPLPADSRRSLQGQADRRRCVRGDGARHAST